jgi:hypothetical protein
MAGDVPMIDFSPIGDLANVYKKSQQDKARKLVLSQLGQGGGSLDYGTAAKQLLAAGDTEGGLTLARLAEAATTRQQDFGLRQAQFENLKSTQTPEYLANRERATQQVQSEFAPKTTNIKTAAGDEITVEKGPGGYRIPQIEGQQAAPNNPFAYGGKMNEAQSKDALYTSRMLNAEKVLRSIDSSVATGWTEKARGAISDKIGFNVRSPEYQKFDQAQRDFINSTLRRESGAVISEGEFDNARKQYFPQPGDTADLIAQKRVNRMEAIKGIGAGAGPGFKPATSFDAQGEIVPNPGAQPAPKPQANAWRTKETVTAARANPQGALAEAKAAIQGGAPREAVIQRLRAVGIDPAGL